MSRFTVGTEVILECWNECIKHVKLYRDILWNQSTSLRLVTSECQWLSFATSEMILRVFGKHLQVAEWNSVIRVLMRILILHILMKMQEYDLLTEEKKQGLETDKSIHYFHDVNLISVKMETKNYIKMWRMDKVPVSFKLFSPWTLVSFCNNLALNSYRDAGGSCPGCLWDPAANEDKGSLSLWYRCSI